VTGVTPRVVPLAELAEAVSDRAGQRPDRTARYVVGIAGPPAAGKSTLATALRDELNRRSGGRVAEVAPMDGFHLSDAELRRIGALRRKGEPDTFDAAAYARLLASVRADADVGWPTFDRSIEATVPGGVVFTPEVRIVVTEGNYLLLDRGAWAAVRPALDDAWFLDADLARIEARLLARHRDGGKSVNDARRKTTESDLPNALLVRQTRHRARLVLRFADGPADQAVRLVITATEPVSDDTTGAIS
jgi:pantothenate kinase